MNKHTPGPWKLNFEPELKRIEVFSPNKVGERLQGKQIALIPLLFIRTDEPEANARLIAAAPELLAAVKSMLTFIETYGGDVTSSFAGVDNENLNHYKALLAKAEGQGE